MGELASKKCVPCEGGISALSPADAKALLKQTQGWEFAQGGKAIKRRFTFKNFTAALALVNKVGDIAESEGHHPDITFGWGYAEFTLWTHVIKGLHENDFIMASKINALQNSAK